MVVLLCETRSWELTADEFHLNLLNPLNADLALCVGDSEREVSNPFYDSAKYIWRFPEPQDWGDAYEVAAGNRDWERLLTIDKHFFGGIENAAFQNLGSGAIIMFFRYLLGLRLNEENLLDEYDWVIITRSDFRWPTVHPPLECLSEKQIYVFDGEQWGGVSDRYIAIPRRWLRKYIEIVDPIFTDPVNLTKRIKSFLDDDTADFDYFNPEKFLAFRMKELNIWNNIRWLPYIPFAVRLHGGHTRWSEGQLDENLGYFIKYLGEYERSRIVERHIRNQNDWRHYFSKTRGFRLRRNLNRELKEVVLGRS